MSLRGVRELADDEVILGLEEIATLPMIARNDEKVFKSGFDSRFNYAEKFQSIPNIDFIIIEKLRLVIRIPRAGSSKGIMPTELSKIII